MELAQDGGHVPRRDIAKPRRETPRMLVRRTLAVEMIPPRETRSTAASLPVAPIASVSG